MKKGKICKSFSNTTITYQANNKDFAILYRTNAQSRSMEEALEEKEYLIKYMVEIFLSKKRN